MCSYQLYIELKEDSIITIGKLGTFAFPAGLYIYTGTAKKNLESRILRHMSMRKKLRWHIDYFLDNPNVTLVAVKRFKEEECELNARTGGTIVIRKFGASDCTHGCGSHLKFLGKKTLRKIISKRDPFFNSRTEKKTPGNPGPSQLIPEMRTTSQR